VKRHEIAVNGWLVSYYCSWRVTIRRPKQIEEHSYGESKSEDRVGKKTFGQGRARQEIRSPPGSDEIVVTTSSRSQSEGGSG